MEEASEDATTPLKPIWRPLKLGKRSQLGEILVSLNLVSPTAIINFNLV